MTWLNKESALEQAFNYRWRGIWSRLPILITDFDIKSLRIVEVYMPENVKDYDDKQKWTAAERPMTDEEFQELNHFAGQKYHGEFYNAIGAEMASGVIRGYVKRPRMEGFLENGYQWTNSTQLGATL